MWKTTTKKDWTDVQQLITHVFTDRQMQTFEKSIRLRTPESDREGREGLRNLL